LQDTLAISGNSSASETFTSRAGVDTGGIEVGNINAWSRSMPQVLQNSQPLRHEAPQW
jgi:hypothetical protein